MGKKKIKQILISQPEPTEPEKSPYFQLIKKFGVQIDYRKFFKIERLKAREFREQKIYLEEYSAIIFTSKLAIDHFFSMCKDLRYSPPITLKYFCLTEAIALYLQKYIQFRKRKIFFCNNNFDELKDTMSKHEGEKYVYPCSDEHNDCLPNYLISNNFNVTKAVFFRPVKENLKDLDITKYDMIVLFSPAGVRSIKDNFPQFEQGETIFAGFGDSTAQALLEHGFKQDINAPTDEFPSMLMAIENFLVKLSKKKC